MMEQEVHSIVKTEEKKKEFYNTGEHKWETQQKLPNCSSIHRSAAAVVVVVVAPLRSSFAVECVSVENVYLCPSRLLSQLSSLFSFVVAVHVWVCVNQNV